MYYPEIKTGSEWELLRDPLSIVKITEKGLLPESIKKGEVKRDNDLGITGIFYGEGDITKMPTSWWGVKFAFSGTTPPKHHGFISGKSYRFEGVRVTRIENVRPREGFKIYVNIGKVISGEYPTDNTGNYWITSWCLNGNLNLHNLRSTSLEFKGEYLIRRGNSPGFLRNKPRFKIPEFWMKGADDHINIRTPSLKATIVNIPGEYGVPSKYKAAVEFPSGYEAFENEALRHDAIEIISYVIGRRFIPLGYAVFIRPDCAVYETAFAPQVDSLNDYYELISVPPIPIRDLPTTAITENKLSNLVKTYLVNRERYSLSNALANYWVSLIAPPNIAFAALIVGIETLIRSWVRISGKPSLKHYIERERWERISEALKNEVNKSMRRSIKKERILNKLDKVNELSQNEQLERFFKDLRLRTGIVERNVFKLRNKLLHGGVIPEDQRELSQIYVSSARTIFNRVFLKLIGFRGDYLDYSVVPPRPAKIGEPLGGPNGDGELPNL